MIDATARICASVVCSVPLPDDEAATICHGHRDQLAADLRQMLDLLPELDTAVARQAIMNESASGARTSDEVPLPFAPVPADLAQQLRQCFGRLVGQLDVSIIEIVDVAQSRLDLIVRRPDVGALTDELHDLAQRIRRAIDLPPSRSRFPVSPCIETVDGTQCRGYVWAQIGRTESDRSLLRCNGCNHEWASHEWLRFGQRALKVAS